MDSGTVKRLKQWDNKTLMGQWDSKRSGTVKRLKDSGTKTVMGQWDSKTYGTVGQ